MPETDDLAAQRLEGVAQQQELAGRVHVRALTALPVPRVPDFPTRSIAGAMS